MDLVTLDWLIAVVVGTPAAAAALIAVLMLARSQPSERAVVLIARTAFLISLAAAGAVAWMLSSQPSGTYGVELGKWFQIGTSGPDLAFRIDVVAVVMMLLASFVCSIIGHFSATYMHREGGHARFFFLLTLFAHGMLLLSTADSLELLFVGWEIVGLTSFLLIGFFYERDAPVSNALYAFATYRICDVGLLMAVVLLHRWHVADVAHPSALESWSVVAAGLGSMQVTAIGLLLLFAIMGKSAQVPAGSWLPRAMEGPTPSSAIFYGALSVHAGIYLAIRAAPFFEASPVARYAMVAVGVLTAIWGTLVGRVQSDVKNALAYATMTQCGVMLVEIALGYPGVALVHLVGHACLRTWQFLRAPSILQEVRDLRASVAGQLPMTGKHIEMLLPERARRVLYRYAIHGFHLDDVLSALLVRPVMKLAKRVVEVEESYTQMFGAKEDSSSEEVLPVANPQGANQP